MSEVIASKSRMAGPSVPAKGLYFDKGNLPKTIVLMQENKEAKKTLIRDYSNEYLPLQTL